LVSSTKISHDYKKLIKYSEVALLKKNLEHSLRFLATASSLAYHYNLTYYDDKLEILIDKISNEITTLDLSTKQKDKIIFYDSFGIDNKGLTHQYLAAIASTGHPFLYILNTENNLECDLIMNQLKNYSNAEVIIVERGLSYLSKINFINKCIFDYNATFSFMQMTPWDVVGVVCWTKNSKLKRFQINLTDHAFWLGKNCFDFIIEFRGFGVSLSNKYRKIPIEKIHLLHYYPILNSLPFSGFPCNIDGKTVILSGGAYFKVYGENGIYFNILKRILDENQNILLFFAGSGDKSPFEEFIKKNDFQDKIYLLGSRTDINSVIEKSDIFLSTYPINGGLMCQLAVANGKIPIVYSDSKFPFNYINLFFKDTLNYNLDFNDLDQFHCELNKIINNKKYRKSIQQNLRDIIPTVEEFNYDFAKLICLSKSNLSENYKFIEFDFDTFSFHKLLLDIENNYLKSYFVIKLNKIFKFYYRYNFLDSILSFIELFHNNFTVIFNKFIFYVRIQKK
jgi:hypothetical protein